MSCMLKLSAYSGISQQKLLFLKGCIASMYLLCFLLLPYHPDWNVAMMTGSPTSIMEHDVTLRMVVTKNEEIKI